MFRLFFIKMSTLSFISNSIKTKSALLEIIRLFYRLLSIYYSSIFSLQWFLFFLSILANKCLAVLVLSLGHSISISCLKVIKFVNSQLDIANEVTYNLCHSALTLLEKVRVQIRFCLWYLMCLSRFLLFCTNLNYVWQFVLSTNAVVLINYIATIKSVFSKLKLVSVWWKLMFLCCSIFYYAKRV